MDWTTAEKRTLVALRTPARIQAFLDELDYDAVGDPASPRDVLRTGKAQCMSGMLFACAALRELGHLPRLMYIDVVSDDGHCLALYEVNGLWGALSKSNYTTLRSREPVYPYLALGLSYFDGYFNRYGKRTMRSFTVPVELEPFEPRGWRFSNRPLTAIERAIDRVPKAWTLPPRTAHRVAKVSELLQQAGLTGAKPEGLWRPKE
jgi:hypothetical protein